ncbi:MAG TPA: D-arabinono-1,4-lactone oxidase [Candidatus Sulfotelmatobacter sp.]|nr:D-arabinono-1,4-lactone oxidase [Candidatus Sulfotelmatobacter sp.]
MSASVWTNWGGTYSCRPSRIVWPSSEDEIVAIVRAARQRGEKLKVVGSGHSFTDVGCTDGCMIKLDRYNKVLGIDRVGATVTAQAGITILQLSAALAESGLAMENMGDVGYQSIAGAISTATHGTGERFRNISSQVIGLSIVQADGEVLACSPDANPDVFRVARVGLGALGVLSTVTLRCVPAFNVRSVQEPNRVDELLDRFDELCAVNDHFEFFWWPHTPWAQGITNTRTQEPPSPGERRTGPRAYINDILLENHAFGMVQRAAQVRRAWIPRLAGFTARTMSRKVMTDRSDRVFANERLVRFAEMEYAVSREALIPAVREIRRMIERKGFLISFPVEVRAVEGDDIPLSPAFGRPTGYVAVHVFHKFEYAPYFREVEAIMDAHEGRPHWGKLHFQTAETLRRRYPEWDRFIAVRDRLDPEGAFQNRYLEQVLGSRTGKVGALER